MKDLNYIVTCGENAASIAEALDELRAFNGEAIIRTQEQPEGFPAAEWIVALKRRLAAIIGGGA